ncbi:MAG: hypothetical protein OHK93_000159 [Ramalina farinacea]|uniref:Letm1 RBD domain-containing protein n=1 Tax=Ramalina farinacea TaxID=258253 RepID=A0AA43TS96_9LECA|nr:hypothetical protein [Ramalina farinacea]
MLQACRKQCSARASHAVLKNRLPPIQLPIQLPVQLSIQLRKQTTAASPQPYKKRESSPPKTKPFPEKKAASQVLKTLHPAANPPKPNNSPPPSPHPINPPPQPSPHPLNLPTRSPSTSKPRHLFSLGKAYLAFYKTGLKNLYHNTTLIRRSTNSLLTSPTSLTNALAHQKLSRAEYFLITRTKSDCTRIPLFLVVFACCGEFTPLLVPFISPVIPRCVWVPVQWEKMRRKGGERRRRLEAEERGGVERVHDEEEKEKGGKGDGVTTAAPNIHLRIEALDKNVEISNDLGMIGARINAWPRLLDRVFGWLPRSVLLGRVSGTAQALVVDDFAIEREGGVGALVDEEVEMAMDARGQDVLGKEGKELRERLEECVKTHAYLLEETRV